MGARTVSWVVLEDGDGDQLVVRRAQASEDHEVEMMRVRDGGSELAVVYPSLADLATFCRELRAWIDAQGYDDPLDPWATPQPPRVHGTGTFTPEQRG